MHKFIVLFLLIYVNVLFANSPCQADSKDSFLSCVESVNSGGSIQINAKIPDDFEVFITKNLTLQGNSSISNGFEKARFRFSENVKNLTIKHLSFFNPLIINSSNGEHYRFEDVRVRSGSNTAHSIKIEQANRVEILNSTLSSLYDSIYIKQANNILIQNTNVLDTGINGNTLKRYLSAPIHILSAQQVDILGGLFEKQNKTIASRVILFENNIDNASIEQSCIMGGEHGIQIGDSINLIISNAKIQDYKLTGISYTKQARLNIRNSCLYGKAPLNPISENNPSNKFTQNYWESKVYEELHDKTTHLTRCLSTGCNTTGARLVLEQRFDKCKYIKTSILKDEINSKYDMVINNFTKYKHTDQKLCNAFVFKQHSSMTLRLPNISDVLNKTASMAFWIKTTQIGDTQVWKSPALFGKEVVGPKDIFWGWINNEGKIGISISDSSDAHSTTPINDDKWHHVVLMKNEKNYSYKIFIDGKKEKEGKFYGDTPIYSKDLPSYDILGRNAGNNVPNNGSFYGSIDELKIYQGELDETQITNIYTYESLGLNYNGSVRECNICPELVSEHRFNECRLANGYTTIDSVNQAYNGVLQNFKNKIPKTTKICKAFTFDKDEKGFIQAQGLDTILNKSASMSYWIKTDQQGSLNPGTSPAIMGGSKGSKKIFWGSIDNNGKVGIHVGNDTKSKSQSSINDDTWHHVALTRDARNNKFQVFVDGKLERYGILDGSDTNLNLSFNEIGRIDGYHNLNAVLDELKIYKGVLEPDSVADIYKNEKEGKRYDGTDAKCTPCSKLQLEYKFDECSLKNGDIKINDANSAIYNGRLQNFTITNPKERKVCNAFTFDKKGSIDIPNVYKPLNQASSLVFWIKTTQKGGRDAWNSPLIFGKDSRGDENDIFWGWINKRGKIGITVGDDRNSVSNKTINDGIWHHVAITRDIDGEYYIYIDGKLDKTGYPKKRTLTPDQIIPYTELGKNSYNHLFEGSLDELKIYGGVLDLNEVQKIYENEKKGLNYNGSKRYCSRCFKFDAWDIFRDANDRGISTKIVNKDFELNIKPVDKFNDAPLDFNGTICVNFTDRSSQNILPNWQKKFIAHDLKDIKMSFKVPKAQRVANAKILWLSGKNETCENIQAKSKDNISTATDNFAIRPKEFYIENKANDKLQAGTSFNLGFYANDFTDKKSENYNERLNVSFAMDIDEVNLQQCGNESGKVEFPKDWSFIDGYKNNQFKLTKSGAFKVKIAERDDCLYRFSSIDCGDKKVDGKFDPNIDTIISPYEQMINLDCKEDARTIMDAWDWFRGYENREISTKIVNRPFDLVIGPPEKVGYIPLQKVCFRIVDADNDNKPIPNFYNKEGWYEPIIVNGKVTLVEDVIRPIKAVKNARIELRWKRNIAALLEKCPLGADAKKRYSSDNFAIRPDSFILEIKATGNKNDGVQIDSAKSGEDIFLYPYALSCPKLDYLTGRCNSASKGYHEREGSTFNFNYKEEKQGCQKGNLTPNLKGNWGFRSGGTLCRGNTNCGLKVSYDDIGDVNFTISDLGLPCEQLFGAVDCKDKESITTGSWGGATIKNWTKEDINIGEGSKIIHFGIDSFLLNASVSNFDNGEFTYFANEESLDKMSANINVSARAVNKQNNILNNYKKECYAKTSSLKLSFNTPDPEKHTNTFLKMTPSYKYFDPIENKKNKEHTEKIELNEDAFKNGIANLNFNINFTRDQATPQNPFIFKLKNLKFKESQCTQHQNCPDTKYFIDNEHFKITKYCKIPKNNNNFDYIKCIGYCKVDQNKYLCDKKNISNKCLKCFDESFEFNENQKNENIFTSNEQNATFYYGKVAPEPLFTKNSALGKALINYEVYDDSSDGIETRQKNFMQNDIGWWKIRYHNRTIQGEVFNPKVTEHGYSLPRYQRYVANFTLDNIINGSQILQVQHKTKDYFKGSIHFESSPWLWYSTQKPAKSYSKLGTCASHPCLDYENKKEDNANFVNSGKDFDGTNLDLQQYNDGGLSRRGVKLFR